MENLVLTDNVCCFIGHRSIPQTAGVITKLEETVEALIDKNGVNIFVFGSRSKFDDISYSVVTNLKNKYPCIKRIYARAEYPHISDNYKCYLLDMYEDTYFALKSEYIGKVSYIERNREIIDRSKYCVFYYDKTYVPKNGKKRKTNSGTGLAYEYAVRKGKSIINLFGE